MGAGRPSLYTPELAEEICTALAASEGGLERLCVERDDFPHRDTVWHWKATKPEFSEMITRAKERQAEHLVYGGLKILQDCEYTESYGSAAVNRAKGEADYRLKMVTKTAPRTMGDRVAVDHGKQPDNPLTASPAQQAIYDALPADLVKQIEKALDEKMMGGEGE